MTFLTEITLNYAAEKRYQTHVQQTTERLGTSHPISHPSFPSSSSFLSLIKLVLSATPVNRGLETQSGAVQN